jgi:hypothetical protein
MTKNTPFTPLKDLVENPERPERWCWERLEAEWPNQNTHDIVKAVMYLALHVESEDGPLGNIGYQLERIANAMESAAKR